MDIVHHQEVATIAEKDIIKISFVRNSSDSFIFFFAGNANQAGGAALRIAASARCRTKRGETLPFSVSCLQRSAVSLPYFSHFFEVAV
jgi:hypothetical protein